MILHIIQARLGSERLPKKTLMKIGGKSLLQHHIERTQIRDTHQIVIMPKQDKEAMKGFPYFDKIDFESDLGDRDVLGAYYRAASKYSPEWVVRTTADCPFIDTRWFIQTIGMATIYGIPVFNCYKEGSTTEVFRFNDLKRAHEEAKDPQDREHVTRYFIHGFAKESIDSQSDFDRERNKYEST